MGRGMMSSEHPPQLSYFTGDSEAREEDHNIAGLEARQAIDELVQESKSLLEELQAATADIDAEGYLGVVS